MSEYVRLESGLLYPGFYAGYSRVLLLSSLSQTVFQLQLPMTPFFFLVSGWLNWSVHPSFSSLLSYVHRYDFLLLTISSSSILAASRSENTICLPRTLLRLRAGTPPSVGVLTLSNWCGAKTSEAEPALGVQTKRALETLRRAVAPVLSVKSQVACYV